MTRDSAALVIITRVLVREGPPKDIGDGQGVTRFGQTVAWLATFGLPSPATVQDAAANYQTWLVKTGLIGVCDYPDDFCDAVVDWAVNSSHRPVIQELQRALGLKPDGTWGPETQAKVDTCDRSRMARRMLAARMRFIGRLVTTQPDKQARWCDGWLSRIATQVETLA